VRNFPNERGFVVGVLKSFLGLSSSVYTSIYVAFFEPDAVAFLLLLALLPTVLSALLSKGLNYVPYVEASEACLHQQQLHQQQQAGRSSSRWSTTQGRCAVQRRSASNCSAGPMQDVSATLQLQQLRTTSS
jgi:hypothetical protein